MHFLLMAARCSHPLLGSACGVLDWWAEFILGFSLRFLAVSPLGQCPQGCGMDHLSAVMRLMRIHQDSFMDMHKGTSGCCGFNLETSFRWKDWSGFSSSKKWSNGTGRVQLQGMCSEEAGFAPEGLENGCV